MFILRALLYSFSFLFHKMPYVVHKSVAWAIGLFWFDILRIRRKQAIENVRKVFPHFSEKQAMKMARKSLFHMGLTLTEFFSMPFLWNKDFRKIVEIENEDILKEALAQKKGVFILSVHLGNGDFGAAALASWGYPIHIISKIFKSKWLNELWFASRKAKGVKFIPPRKSSYEILKALKAKEAVIFVFDQYTGPPNGVLTTFFGHQTGTAAGLSLFAGRSGAPVLPMYTYRTGPFRHKIVVKPEILFEEKASKDETIIHMTEKYNRAVEKAILEKPEQWMWVHRRWKKGFPGQLD